MSEIIKDDFMNDVDRILNMTDKQAAEVLEKVQVWMNSGRRNGKTLLSLAYNKAIEKAIKALEADRWIPIIMRPLTDEEQFVYPDLTFIFDCRMPENGQEILISTKYGVEFDTCFADDGCYLDSDRDWEEVYAWRPLPKPYESEDK